MASTSGVHTLIVLKQLGSRNPLKQIMTQCDIQTHSISPAKSSDFLLRFRNNSHAGQRSNILSSRMLDHNAIYVRSYCFLLGRNCLKIRDGPTKDARDSWKTYPFPTICMLHVGAETRKVWVFWSCSKCYLFQQAKS